MLVSTAVETLALSMSAKGLFSSSWIASKDLNTGVQYWIELSERDGETTQKPITKPNSEAAIEFASGSNPISKVMPIFCSPQAVAASSQCS
ncbi:MAG: hypothetical protein R3D26_06365 [Cyanobacteriota/Melainabacteria group bacterium]